MSPAHYVALAVILFVIGGVGVLVRRNAIVIFMCVELMLNAASLNFIAFWQARPAPDTAAGVIFVLFAIAVGAANVSHIDNDPALSRQYAGQVEPDTMRRGISRAAVSS